MTASDHNHSIAGSWMGQYFYLGEQDGSAFEVVFVEIGSGFEKRVEGSVLDNCNLGEAMVSGSFTYPSLQFIKTYISVRIDPVEYRGTMNEDGTMIAGNWYIRPRDKDSGSTMGTWIATRGDGGEEFTFDVDQTKDEINDEVKEEKKIEVPTQPALR
ncbi:hypothetical protein KA344_19785 [bacterium]|nr:hypothetical protein [bacterium]